MENLINNKFLILHVEWGREAVSAVVGHLQKGEIPLTDPAEFCRFFDKLALENVSPMTILSFIIGLLEIKQQNFLGCALSFDRNIELKPFFVDVAKLPHAVDDVLDFRMSDNYSGTCALFMNASDSEPGTFLITMWFKDSEYFQKITDIMQELKYFEYDGEDLSANDRMAQKVCSQHALIMLMEIYRLSLAKVRVTLLCKGAEVIIHFSPCCIPDLLVVRAIVHSEAVKNGTACSNCNALIAKKCGCKLVRYCSVECQKQHWPVHKDSCLERRKKPADE